MAERTPSIHVFDCTLRDGSYMVDYQFTAEDTYLVSLGLAQAGFKFIEVGHGLGMGCGQRRKGDAAASDAEYILAARAALGSIGAKIGMFFIPGIGTEKDLEEGVGLGLDFIRVGTNVNEIDSAEPYIRLAKDLGLMVFSNLMKSYAVTPEEFKKCALKADRYGADVIVVVDSAGGMLPDDVREYVGRLRSATTTAIGFHGHNNLQLGIANSLAAVEAGAVFVDCSLQGMGRSAGNAQTEVMVMVLEKMGYPTGIDPYRAMDIGSRIVRTMTAREQGVDDLSLASGIAQFHSGFLPIIDEMVAKYHVDPRRLIVEVSKIDRVNVSRELADRVAAAMRRERGRGHKPALLAIHKSIVIRRSFADPVDQARGVLKDLVSLSRKTARRSVFSFTLSRRGQRALPFLRHSAGFVIANIEAAGIDELRAIVTEVQGQVDWILLDESCAELRTGTVASAIKHGPYAWYSEERILLTSLCAFLSQRLSRGAVLVYAEERQAKLLSLMLRAQGLEGVAASVDGDGACRKHLISAAGVAAVCSFGREYAAALDADWACLLPEDALVCSARPKAFPKPFWDGVMARELMVSRIDARAALVSEVNLVVETSETLLAMGRGRLEGVPVVSGGVIGEQGCVVLDSVRQPGRVIGVCDGQGGLLSPDEEGDYLDRIERARAAIIRGMYQGTEGA